MAWLQVRSISAWKQQFRGHPCLERGWSPAVGQVDFARINDSGGVDNGPARLVRDSEARTRRST